MAPARSAGQLCVLNIYIFLFPIIRCFRPPNGRCAAVAMVRLKRRFYVCTVDPTSDATQSGSGAGGSGAGSSGVARKRSVAAVTRADVFKALKVQQRCVLSCVLRG